MTGGPDAERRRTLEGIENRKIAILMEIGEVNREYDERVSALREEYAELDAEYFTLRFERMTGDRPSMPLWGVGNHDTE